MKIPIEETIEGFPIRGYSWWFNGGLMGFNGM
jgi:hypothetical protein